MANGASPLPVSHRGRMAFYLFVGFGLGSLLFQAALMTGFTGALSLLGVTALMAAGVALVLFRKERPANG